MIDIKFQRGIAVITVLLALAIGVLICSEVIMRVYHGVKRSGNHFNTQQAWEYALGGEAWARQQLNEDIEKDKKTSRVDHLLEKWAVPVQKMDIEGGTIQIEIYDMQSRFNLNNLITEDGAIDPVQVNILKEMFSYLGVRPAYADMAARWASYADDTDNMYDSDKNPYRAGDTQFGSVSEMRQLKDIEMKEYRRMQPFLSALPVPVTININTAPGPVLASMTDNSEQAVERLKSFIEQRKLQQLMAILHLTASLVEWAYRMRKLSTCWASVVNISRCVSLSSITAGKYGCSRHFSAMIKRVKSACCHVTPASGFRWGTPC
jgi:general secretion pathway protein K